MCLRINLAVEDRDVLACRTHLSQNGTCFKGSLVATAIAEGKCKHQLVFHLINIRSILNMKYDMGNRDNSAQAMHQGLYSTLGRHTMIHCIQHNCDVLIGKDNKLLKSQEYTLQEEELS